MIRKLNSQTVHFDTIKLFVYFSSLLVLTTLIAKVTHEKTTGRSNKIRDILLYNRSAPTDQKYKVVTAKIIS
jgi:hypothetical protein